MATASVHGATKRVVPVQKRLQSGPLHHASPGKKERSVSDKKSPSESERLLRYKEVKGDLFSSPSTSSLGHCVSADMAMGKGVATLFKKNFGGVGELKAQGVKTGGVAILKRDDRYIYYLVTKPRYFHKPTYETLRSSLIAMKAHCVAHDVEEVCLPRIGCGLDRLEWGNVSSMLQEIFGDLDMTMTIYYI